MRSRWRLIATAASILVAAVTVALWAHMLGVTGHAVEGLFRRLQWWTLPCLFALQALHAALSGWRWSLIEQALGGARPDFRRIFVPGAVGLGLGTFLPGPVAAVACRAVANRLDNQSASRAVYSSFLDQLADGGIMALMILPAIVALTRHSLSIYLAGGAAMILVGAVLAVAAPLGRSALARFRFSAALVPLLETRLLFAIFGWSLLRLVNLTAITLLVHAATGAGSPAALIVSIPIVALAIAAAMLPGAFGVSEWSFTAVLSAWGVPAPEIVLFVLGNRIILSGLALALAAFAWICAICVPRRQESSGSNHRPYGK